MKPVLTARGRALVPGRVALVSVLLLAGCGMSSGAPGASSDSTATHPAQSGSAAPQRMTLRDDLVSPQPLQWDSYKEIDPQTVELTFLAGPASCSGVTAAVQQTGDLVTIDLSTGALPGSQECAAVALMTTTTVKLDQPLAGRKVRQS